MRHLDLNKKKNDDTFNNQPIEAEQIFTQYFSMTFSLHVEDVESDNAYSNCFTNDGKLLNTRHWKIKSFKTWTTLRLQGLKGPTLNKTKDDNFNNQPIEAEQIFTQHS